jgi:hypothetical protein
MFLFPSAMIMGGGFSVMDYLVWNEIPTVLGNLVGGLAFTGLTLYSTHIRTAARRNVVEHPQRRATAASAAVTGATVTGSTVSSARAAAER